MLQKPKILVVDNDATFLRQMKTLLREMGTVPRCLSSSLDACQRKVEMSGFLPDRNVLLQG